MFRNTPFSRSKSCTPNMNRRSENKDRDVDRKSVFQICGPVLQFSHLLIDPQKDVKIQAHRLSFDDTREFSQDAFEVVHVLGSGHFGTVYKGILKQVPGLHGDIDIAIKTNTDDGEDERRDFLNEMKIMGHVEPHNNLVSMIGFCKNPADDGMLCILLEYCQHGELVTFLRKNKKRMLGEASNEIGVDSSVPEINSRYLIRWAYDITKGMEYLNEKRIMHGDLAARNIMLTEKPQKNGTAIVAMVADFGLSKNFYSTQQRYNKSKRLTIPWRWMAIEFLSCGYFTLTSDVWSFGVVIWELLSFGKQPYGHLDEEKVIDNLESGQYLSFPEVAHDIENWPAKQFYYELTLRCFTAEPENRADFFEIGSIIEKYLSSEESIAYADIQAEYLNKSRRMSCPLRNNFNENHKRTQSLFLKR